ncbi:MAG: cytochrome c oxidase, subunit [Solirubrobacterales bacterium]|nr:cytochrome c oxidase, subunit [Solirubrobacterales bacterium]
MRDFGVPAQSTLSRVADIGGLVVTRTEYKRLFDVYVPIALGVFAVIVALILFAVLRYRRRPVERAARWHENNPLETAYALALLAVVVFLLYLTFGAEHKVDTVSAEERPQLRVDVIGAKWEWRFGYPAYGINRYSGTVGHEALVVPTDEAIRFRLVSRDVIHEFWVPELRYKHDLIPGYPQEITLTFPQRGSFPGECAEFCGLYHARMIFTVDAVSPSEFEAWARSESRSRSRS